MGMVSHEIEEEVGQPKAHQVPSTYMSVHVKSCEKITVKKWKEGN